MNLGEKTKVMPILINQTPSKRLIRTSIKMLPWKKSNTDLIRNHSDLSSKYFKGGFLKWAYLIKRKKKCTKTSTSSLSPQMTTKIHCIFQGLHSSRPWSFKFLYIRLEINVSKKGTNCCLFLFIVHDKSKKLIKLDAYFSISLHWKKM